MNYRLFAFVFFLIMPLAGTSSAGQVSITQSGGEICIRSDGLPDHKTGNFPNAGNPNSIRPQRIKFCVNARPVKRNHATVLRGTVGIALNGIAMRPGTAEFWDPNSPRGFSRNRSSGWNYEGMGAGAMLGMDLNNAHVDPRGFYHYHKVPGALAGRSGGSHIGYAADGFEIHYVGDGVKSGYRLKPGTRQSGPGGKHDGTFVEDWEFAGGAGKLDQCNGGMLNGKFVYFATKTFPFFPRCVWGEPSRDFRR